MHAFSHFLLLILGIFYSQPGYTAAKVAIKPVRHLVAVKAAPKSVVKKEAPSDKAIDYIRYGEARLRGNSTQSVMRMTIHRPSFTRSLKVRSWTRGADHALVEILDPAKEEGVSSLRNETQMWNYLPKTDQVVRVPSSLMLQSWMGSDFTNDDLMKASSLVRDYRHTIVKYGTIDKERVVQIQCLPKPNAPVVWGKIMYFARMSDKLPVKQAFFDEKGKLVRTLFMSHFKTMDDRTIPTEITVRRADEPKEYTTVVYEKILYNREVAESVFNRDQLRQNAQQGKVITAGWMFRHLPESWFR